MLEQLGLIVDSSDLEEDAGDSCDEFVIDELVGFGGWLFWGLVMMGKHCRGS